MTNNFNIQNIFESSNENNTLKVLPNGKVLININNQIYIFKRSSKSRFFNLFKNEEIQISNPIKENNLKNNNNPDLLIDIGIDNILNKKKKKKQKIYRKERRLGLLFL